MNLELNSFSIDVIFLIFCIFFSILGYCKGFIKRLYDLAGTILSLIIAYVCCDTFSQIYTFIPANEYTQNNIFLPIINNIISFIVLFIILWLIKSFLGILIKPVLQSIVSFLKLTEFIDKVLGVILSLIEVFVISYFALTLMMTPLVNNGYNLVNESKIAKHILLIVPEFSKGISDWSQQYVDLLDETVTLNNEQSVNFLITTYQLGLLKDDQMILLIENDLKDSLVNKNYNLNDKQKEILIKLINKSHLEKNIKLKILNKVSE